jgi:hypothetical protein
MSMRKATLAGVVAIAALFGCALVFLDWVMRDGPSRAGRTDAASRVVEPLPAPPAISEQVAIDQGPSPAEDQLLAPPAPADGAYEPGRPRRLPRGTPAPVDLLGSLAEVRTRILACAGPRATIPNPPKRPPPLPGQSGLAGRTVMLLDLEQAEGEVIVQGAAVQSRGDASDELLACAQRELAGKRLPAGAARSGKNITMQFPLDPPGR